MSIHRPKESSETNQKIRKLLDFLRSGEVNATTQARFYERGDQCTLENGSAYYEKLTTGTKYARDVYLPAKHVLQKLCEVGGIAQKQVVYDLGAGADGVSSHLTEKQEYHPLDISAYFLEKIKTRRTNGRTEGHMVDCLSTNFLRHIPDQEGMVFVADNFFVNFTDAEIASVLDQLLPPQKHEQSLLLTYFDADAIDRTDEIQVEQLCAAYGQKITAAGFPNRFFDQATYEITRARTLGGFEQLGFPTDKLELCVLPDEKEKTIRIGVICKENITVKLEGQTYARKEAETILPIHSRRFAAHMEQMLRERGRVVQHKEHEQGSVGVWCTRKPAISKRKVISSIALLAFLTLCGVGLWKQTEKQSKLLPQMVQKLLDKDVGQTGNVKELLSGGGDDPDNLQKVLKHVSDRIYEQVDYCKAVYGIQGTTHDELIGSLIVSNMMADSVQLLELLKDPHVSGDVSKRVSSRYAYVAANLTGTNATVDAQLKLLGDEQKSMAHYLTYMPALSRTRQAYNDIFVQKGKWEYEIHDLNLVSDGQGGWVGCTYIGPSIDEDGHHMRIYLYGDLVVASYPDAVDPSPKKLRGKEFVYHVLDHMYKVRGLSYQLAEMFVKKTGHVNISGDMYGWFGPTVVMPAIEEVLIDDAFNNKTYASYFSDEQKLQDLLENRILQNSSFQKKCEGMGINTTTRTITDQYSNYMSELISGL